MVYKTLGLFAALFAQCVFCSYSHSSEYDAHYVPSYHGPTAKPVVLHSGYLEDTHEVAAAKKAHHAAQAKQSHYESHYDSNDGVYSHDDHDHLKYHGPSAVPHVLHNGHIADTHEVAAAKESHLAATAHAKVSSSSNYDSSHSHYVPSYHGPTAKPVVLHNGYLADTHEVAATKDAHHAAQAKQSHYEGHHDSNHGVYNHDDHDHLKYHGPYAIPHVLHNGHIADTHEVAAAKEHHIQALQEASHHGY